MQEQPIDHAKDGSVGADAEGERESGDGSEAGRLAQHAEAKAQILEQSFEQGQAASVAALLF
jgi:hypothetical protein